MRREAGVAARLSVEPQLCPSVSPLCRESHWAQLKAERGRRHEARTCGHNINEDGLLMKETNEPSQSHSRLEDNKSKIWGIYTKGQFGSNTG